MVWPRDAQRGSGTPELTPDYFPESLCFPDGYGVSSPDIEAANKSRRPGWCADIQHLKGREIGLAFTGGGSRAATAAVGQLRALTGNERFWGQVRYVSGVSGSTWALAPLFFGARRGEGPSNHSRRLLGEETASREELLKSDIESRGGGRIIQAIIRSTNANQRYSKHFEFQGNRAWARTVGDIYLKGVGLDPESRFALGRAHLRSMMSRLRNNGGRLNPREFLLPAPDFPFLIVNGSTLTQQKLREGDDSQILPLEITPLYAGIRGWFDATAPADYRFGGGYREAVFLDSDVKAETYDKERGTVYAVINDARRVSLADVVGIAGSAAVETVARLPLFAAGSLGFRDVTFRKPLDSGGKLEAVVVGDGEHLDNLAITPLLARRVPKIVSFINTTRMVDASTALDDLLVLFGSHDTRRRAAVFHPRGLELLRQELIAKHETGGPAVACTQFRKDASGPLRWLPRNTLGIRPYDVTICWVYLARSQGFMARLEPPLKTVALSESGDYKNFPYYATALQEGLQLLDLDTGPANLLAALTEWSLQESLGVIEAAFAAPLTNPGTDTQFCPEAL